MGTASRRSGPWLVALAIISAACSSTGAPTTGEITEPGRVSATAPSATNLFRTGRTLVIPHGGGDGLFPENTMYAYEQSMELGGDVIDIDVRVAADGVLVAFHDSTLDRTTEASGSVDAMTSAELGQLDAAYDFEVDGSFPYRSQGMAVPTVEEIMRAFPDALTTIDLKVAGATPIQPICDLLRALGRADDVYVGTESNDQPELFRAACPEIHTSGTSEERQIRRDAEAAGEVSSPIPQMVSQPSYLDRDGQPRFTAEYVDFAQASDTALFTWVIDDRKTLTELIEMGVDGIYTRRPDVMLDVLVEMGLRPS